jgi:ATP-binding cassette subfamily F protein 3
MIFHDVFFRLNKGDRVGLIGKNGVGKTTILKLILGQEEPTSGTVEMEKDIRIGYFSQFSELNGEMTIQQVFDDVFSDIHTIEKELSEIETELKKAPKGKQLQQLIDKQSRLLEEMEHRDGWTYQTRIDTVLNVLGFSDVYRDRPIEQLSGGWRNRSALAKILLEEPDVLLMDEPTNYLDISGIEWLEDWFNKLRGALIIISHDRHFLDLVVNRVVEIENYHFQEYEGNFTQYICEKKIRIKTLENQFQHEEELLAFESEAIADRNEMKKDPSKALKSKLAKIKKRVEPRPVDKIITNLYNGIRVSNKLCRIEGISKAYDGYTLFRDVSMDIGRGDRIAVVGPNGCGKTTLLRILTGGELSDTGKIDWEKNVECSYYNQVLEELDLNDSSTHTLNVTSLGFTAPRKLVNRFLSLMQFSEMDIEQKIRTLSGGQRARVALAKSLLSGASMIVLDEPTNHLDLTSTQVMERALIHFPGAVVVASHDRFFIDKVATRLLIFEDSDKLREFNGNWTLYQASIENPELMELTAEE